MTRATDDQLRVAFLDGHADALALDGPHWADAILRRVLAVLEPERAAADALVVAADAARASVLEKTGMGVSHGWRGLPVMERDAFYHLCAALAAAKGPTP